MNPVRGCLVERAVDWPGTIWLPGQRELVVKRPDVWFSERMPEQIRVPIVPPPAWRGSEDEWHERMAELVAEEEATLLRERIREERPVMGRQRVLDQKPTSAPKTKPSEGKKINPVLATGGDGELLKVLMSARRGTSTNRGSLGSPGIAYFAANGARGDAARRDDRSRTAAGSAGGSFRVMTEPAHTFDRRRIVLWTVLLATACGGSASGGTSGSSTTESTASTTTESGGGESTGGGETATTGEFVLSDSSDAGSAHGDHPSEITATRTHAAMRFFVVDPETGPIEGIVVKLTAPDGTPYFTEETDSVGYAEVLVPAGVRYDLEYLSLGRRSAEAHVDVPAGPNQDIRLTLRYRRRHPRPRAPDAPPPEPEHLVLEGVLFESGSATLTADSGPRLDRVAEYMIHHPDVRVRIAGHTDNVGNPARNRTLSQQRADAVRAYLVEHGVEASRLEAVGLGDTEPVASNDTEEGRAENRRIEAIELE
jgi:outer membrane protein OmpA-like peptidoglycan-associated protein